MDEEIAKFTTPRYRAPEMIDSLSNYPVNTASDIWALGCILFQLCFHKHPFEDGSKYQIINAFYDIPQNDYAYEMFHEVIQAMLAINPKNRSPCQEVQERLGEVAIRNCWDLEAKIDFAPDPIKAVPFLPGNEILDTSTPHTSGTVTANPSLKKLKFSQTGSHKSPSKRTVGDWEAIIRGRVREAKEHKDVLLCEVMKHRDQLLRDRERDRTEAERNSELLRQVVQSRVISPEPRSERALSLNSIASSTLATFLDKGNQSDHGNQEVVQPDSNIQLHDLLRLLLAFLLRRRHKFVR